MLTSFLPFPERDDSTDVVFGFGDEQGVAQGPVEQVEGVPELAGRKSNKLFLVGAAAWSFDGCA